MTCCSTGVGGRPRTSNRDSLRQPPALRVRGAAIVVGVRAGLARICETGVRPRLGKAQAAQLPSGSGSAEPRHASAAVAAGAAADRTARGPRGRAVAGSHPRSRRGRRRPRDLPAPPRAGALPQQHRGAAVRDVHGGDVGDRDGAGPGAGVRLDDHAARRDDRLHRSAAGARCPANGSHHRRTRSPRAPACLPARPRQRRLHRARGADLLGCDRSREPTPSPLR